ncbi:MAG: ABC transporter ATP-binding protein [Lewinella sp.]
MTGFRKVWRMLTSAERQKFSFLALIVFVMSVLEVVGVVSVLPFIQLVADPGIVDRNEFLHQVYVTVGFTNIRQMMIWAGVAVIGLLCLTNTFAVFKTWLQFKTSWSVAHQVSVRLLQAYLARPYEYFLNRNTTEFTTFIIGETTHLTNGVILPIIEVFSRGLVCIIILSLLLWVDVKIALVMFGALGAAYTIIFLFQRRYLRRVGEQRIDLSVKRYQSVIQLFNGIKTVQVFNRDSFFADRYEDASREFCDIQPKYNVTVTAPRYILEILAFSTIVVVTIHLYLTVGDIVNIIPKLSLYAVAGYRLLPALQAGFAAVGKLVHTWPVIDKLYDALFVRPAKNQHQTQTLLSEAEPVTNKIAEKKIPTQLALREEIRLNNLTFTYENNERPTLRDINLTIKQGETVAFVGATGSGKTTLVDLIVGLLSADEGEVMIDQTALTPALLSAWRSDIAYVPQDVFLFDDTVARNISLKETLTEAEEKRLWEAAKMADIHRFISSELTEGYHTMIGEKGVRLSGGQRQRLGLARAFFHQPAVLVLDEATSALDNVTERGIIDSLNNLPQEITTIVIAHRLSTVRHADRIFLVRDGAISASGTFAELEQESESFQEMARSV